jgi:hypothetical protein
MAVLAQRRALGAMRAEVDRMSKAGSCPTHTPFCTFGEVLQPTEQWPQIVDCALAASDFLTSPGAIWLARATPPAVKPALRRNARRFREIPLPSAFRLALGDAQQRGRLRFS